MLSVSMVDCGVCGWQVCSYSCILANHRPLLLLLVRSTCVMSSCPFRAFRVRHARQHDNGQRKCSNNNNDSRTTSIVDENSDVFVCWLEVHSACLSAGKCPVQHVYPRPQAREQAQRGTSSSLFARFFAAAVLSARLAQRYNAVIAAMESELHGCMFTIVPRRAPPFSWVDG